jgi:hypothetical protein
MQILSAFLLLPIKYDHLNLLLRLIKKAIIFKRAGIFINPSRAATHHIRPSTPSDTQSSYALLAASVGNHSYAVFTSVIAVNASNILIPDTQSPFHQISGVLCIQEWERFCSFFCMVFGRQELQAQIYEDAIAMSTRARPKESGMWYLNSVYMILQMLNMPQAHRAASIDICPEVDLVLHL